MPRMLSRPSLLIGILLLSGRMAIANEDFESWHLEPSVGQAHLVMVARVASISRLTVVEGAKTDVSLREYRFQPVRRLKGIFQRDQLSMTAADLGCVAGDGALAPPLKEGEFRLLILTQQEGNSYGCVSNAAGASFGQRVPLITGPEDPLVAVAETLIQVADSRSRRERARLLVSRLEGLGGVASVPILSSLRLRSDWVAADDRSLPHLNRMARDKDVAVRRGAVEALRDVLANRMVPGDPRQLDEVAETLRQVFASTDANTKIRLAALHALEHLIAMRSDISWARGLLLQQLTSAGTYAERAAAATALSRIVHPESIAAVHEVLAQLPLDEISGLEAEYARAAIKLDAAGAERILLVRFRRSLDARQSIKSEVDALAQMRSSGCLPLLLTAAEDPHVSAADLRRIAVALSRVGDDRAVPILMTWLRGADYQLKELSLAALENLDSPVAAREARPLLKTEAHLPYKLRLARLLARHELPDGYALATEHLADGTHTAQATLVLAALNDARTLKDLTAIVSGNPDRRWHAAALSGLAAIGDDDARKKLEEILNDDRHPLATDAALAAGLANSGELLKPLATLAQSRNRKIAQAALIGLRWYFSSVRSTPRGLASIDREADDREVQADRVPAEIRSAIASAVASLVSDPYVDLDLRLEALAVAKLLRGEGYTDLLKAVADQAELEGSPLLAAVEAEFLRERGIER